MSCDRIVCEIFDLLTGQVVLYDKLLHKFVVAVLNDVIAVSFVCCLERSHECDILSLDESLL